MINKKLLLICYSFPPYPGIGGRRWAKFAKYLARNGSEIHVISQLNKSSIPSEWFSDINHRNIRLYPQDVFYPQVFNSYPTSVIKKIEYRFWILVLKIFSRGMLYDRSFFWKKTISNKVKDIVEKNGICNIIVTGPPFHYMYFLAEFKKRNPQVNLTLDFRDPWTDNSTFMGIDLLSKRRLENEKMWEKDAIEAADTVIAANEYYTELLKKKYSKIQKKFHTIPNGIDIEEYSNLIVHNKENNDVNFVLAGSLYNSTEYVVKPLIDYLERLKVGNLGLYNRLKFYFYGNVDRRIEALILDSNLDCIKIKGFVRKDIVIQAIVDADYCLMFTPPNHSDNFNTKFYEYIALRKPIVHFSNDGAISRFLVNNKLGFPVKPDSFEYDMNFLNQEVSTTYNYGFDVSTFDVKSITVELEKLL